MEANDKNLTPDEIDRLEEAYKAGIIAVGDVLKKYASTEVVGLIMLPAEELYKIYKGEIPE